jgi:hypothetical protein
MMYDQNDHGQWVSPEFLGGRRRTRPDDERRDSWTSGDSTGISWKLRVHSGGLTMQLKWSG